MYAENAATKRQVDEIEGKVKVIEEQIKSSFMCLFFMAIAYCTKND